MNKYMALMEYAKPAYRKCELCKRVRDVHYRFDISSASAKKMLVGSLDLCKTCAANVGEIIHK